MTQHNSNPAVLSEPRTFPTTKPSRELVKLGTGILIVASFTVPVFRSGGRTGLTFWQWIINHTIWGPPVEYVPEEDYMRELEGVKLLARDNGSGDGYSLPSAVHMRSSDLLTGREKYAVRRGQNG